MLKIRYSHASLLITLVGIHALVTYVASANSLGVLKPVSALMFILIVAQTVVTLAKFGATMHTPRLAAIILVLSAIPVSRIWFDGADQGSIKGITDAVFIFGPYYFMPLIGAAFLAAMTAVNVTLDSVIRASILPVGLVSILFTAAGLIEFSAAQVVGMYIVFDSLLIPMAFLIFFRSDRRNLLIGGAALLALLATCAIFGSRSYMLVAIYIFFFAMFASFQSGVAKALSVIALIVTLLLAIPLLTVVGTGAQFETDVELVKKLRLDSLIPTIQGFLLNWNFIDLYFWEGNSRANIILDAFSGFGFWEYLWGRGVFATYSSFVDRNTIEVGLAQELFWVGTSYLVPFLVLLAASFVRVRGIFGSTGSYLAAALSAVIMVKFLDFFVYGMPRFSGYSLLMWAAIASVALKARYVRPIFVNDPEKRAPFTHMAPAGAT